MGNVFISYAREDASVARDFADLLGTRGWSVWWDRRLLAGDELRTTILGELEQAHAVVVIWSANSVGSRWVLDEARLAYDRGVLVPTRLDGAQIPLGFGQLHTVDVSSDDTSIGRREVVEAVGRKLPIGADGEPVDHAIRVAADRGFVSGRDRLRRISAASLMMAPLIAAGFALVVRSRNAYANSLGYLVLALAAFMAAKFVDDEDPWRRATRAVLAAAVLVMVPWGVHLSTIGYPRDSRFENVVTLAGVWLLAVMVLPFAVRYRSQLQVGALVALYLSGFMIWVFFRVHIDWAGVVVAALTPILLVAVAWSVEGHARFVPNGP